MSLKHVRVWLPLCMSLYVFVMLWGKIGTGWCTAVRVHQQGFSVNSDCVYRQAFALMYEGWNFNSGNYLFTIDTK